MGFVTIFINALNMKNSLFREKSSAAFYSNQVVKLSELEEKERREDVHFSPVWEFKPGSSSSGSQVC
jgi:hypothetical protein